mgnify:CR=1 FL=1
MWFWSQIDSHFVHRLSFDFYFLAHVVLSIVVLRDQVYHNGHGEEEEEERAEELLEEGGEGDYEYVLTDEWMEFFAKSEARRQESNNCFFHRFYAIRDSTHTAYNI